MKYNNHLVAFIDILGFSEICLASNHSEEERNKLSMIFEVCNSAIDDFKRIEGKEKIKSIIVSDSIIMTLKTEESLNLEEIRNFVLAVGRLQYDLALTGFWIRGGISHGLLHIDVKEKQVVGPALIKAINLEKKGARYPRVIADNTLILNSNFSSAIQFRNAINQINFQSQLKPFFEWHRDPLYKLTPRIQDDVPLFVDFLKSKNEDSLLQIVKMVSKGLKGSLEHYEKYRWLADYILTSTQFGYYSMGNSRYEIEQLLL